MVLAHTPPLTFVIDPDGLARVAAVLGLTGRELARAAAGAVNDVAKTARSTVRREIAAHVTLPKKSINQRVEVTKRASQDDPTAVVSLDARPDGRSARPTLLSFGGQPKVPRVEAKRTKTGKLTKKGRQAFEPFTYQIMKQGGRKQLPGGFVQRRRTGAQNVLAMKRMGKARYPLMVPRGPSVAALWQAPQNPIQRKTIDDTRGRLSQRINARVELTLDGKFKRRS